MFEDIIGTIGVCLIVVSYFLLQIEKIHSTDLIYSILNIIGSLMILVSIFKNWNLASFLIEFFWILISCIGLYKYILDKRALKNKKNTIIDKL